MKKTSEKCAIKKVTTCRHPKNKSHQDADATGSPAELKPQPPSVHRPVYRI